ncbi:uncharacterized protein LOC123915111 [Trifolium pratense]|uniref:uncharacterized protein LOC123915103 n=1 Tax=Trifolium pratense TaxID=57577 RepID=UPI001E69317B|nr:uncharacterized protein LOC123915103 [Trifolium pratense]XP_045822218.1 uncharacterized protein LOC123915111 [Trifolium pratense]
MKVIEQLKRHLMRAQQVMKNQADNKRKDGIFNVGDIVLVKLQPYWQHSVDLRKNKKLSTRQFGPLTVIEKIGNLAYKLKLLATTKIHPVFHISQLKEFKSSNEEPYFRLPLTTSETGKFVTTIQLSTFEDKVEFKEGGIFMKEMTKENDDSAKLATSSGE